MIRKVLLTIPLFLLPLAACAREETMPPAASQGTPAPIEPISSRGGQDGSAPMAGQAQDGSVHFDLPSNWQEQPPSTSMRMAQAVIPGNPGSGGPGEVVVFFFGPGGGGGVEENIQRWIAQMETAPGSNPQPETFEANGFRITWIDVSGTLKPSSMGMGPATPQPGSRLYGAVVEGPGGPWFFKATGPEATLAAERENFVKMLRSVRGN